MQNNELDTLLASLPAERFPEQDLWPALANRLPARSHKHNWLWLSGGLAAALALFALIWWQPAGENPALTVAQLEQQYQQRLSLQLASIEQIDEAYGDWQWQLALWQHAISQVQQALGFYPEDPKLQQQLLSLYQQQLDYVSMLTDVTPVYY
ncbi:hypothetical protein GCM10010919_05150 [Alishewanella longhuensis]|uniref:Anti-sigma factor n=1 Tax=Alishewanella longhuensis TaxID=1091037 RepID=A0ABQ3KW10_9ALTE|nr:hypothetical protein [Alishewanella longhuensis]GHG61075.1 hypothetical protein GCM10010919_05150 [Alishewanella longhuensis]